MSTETPKPSLAPWIMVALALATATGLVGYALARKQAAGSGNDKVWTRFVEQDVRQRNLEAQIKDLEKTVSELKGRQAKAAPTPSAAADPALTAQLNSLATTLAAMAESQKAQQAALAQLANKPAPQPAEPAKSTIPREQMIPVTPATPPKATPPKPVPVAANSVEAAYKQAWETDKPVIIGQTMNPKTGQLEGGRTLDPAQAKVMGLADWREWYATEEKARRAELETQAGKELEHSENKLVEIPRGNKP